ncbi:MAG: helix-turn-helix domain-containing protein [Burkholderiales bacterium]|nr:helix-turn-helix domain-containing protein [Burkholderiales bacterium]
MADVFTLEDLEVKLKVGKRTLYKYIKEGRLGALKVGRGWRIPLDAYNKFLAEGMNSTEMKSQKNAKSSSAAKDAVNDPKRGEKKETVQEAV